MARTSNASKRGKPLPKFFAVICGKKVESKVDGAATTEGSTEGAETVPNASAVPSDASHVAGKEKAGDSKCTPDHSGYPDLVSGGHLEVHRLEHPTKEELKASLESLCPEFVSFQGEQASGKTDVGGIILHEDKVDTPEDLVALFGSKLPNLVYLETPSGEKAGNALLKLGIRHVIYWKLASCTRSMAFHFRQGLIAALQSSVPGGWEAYQLAKSCSQIYFYRSKIEGQPVPRNCWPHILGEAPPKIQILSAEVPADGEKPKASDAATAPIQIFDDEVDVRMLVCTEISKPENPWLDAIEGGLSHLLSIEARGLRMLNKISVPPPPMAAAVFARGIVTMRCDICTRSFARVAILVSGSAQTCFDDQQLESSIKKELVERTRVIRVIKPVEDKRAPVPFCEMRRSICLAAGARTVEARFKTPAWALQVLRQLAVNPSYRTFVAFGIAGVQGSPVAAFTKEDALLIACSNFERPKIDFSQPLPAWFKLPPPTKKRVSLVELSKRLNEIRRSEDPAKTYSDIVNSTDPSAAADKELFAGRTLQQNLNLLETAKPIPQRAHRKPNPYAGLVAAAQAGPSTKSTPTGPSGKAGRSNVSNGGPPSGANNSQSATPGSLLLAGKAPHVKAHGCNRRHIDDCAEEEFTSDLIKFLVSRGHGRLIPPAGAEGFPEVVLNGKRLDLYNLYREVVSRGGFHVGNGINWKGQVFSKMRNHTHTNKMTGVGNTLKKHYETYLLEYELAHNDVDGECCILCHSGAAGDWVNCGSCGEWAHFGCDKRTGLGTFKEYSKTDGLDYICPNCSTANGRLTKRNKVKHSSDEPTETARSKGSKKSGK